MKGCEDCKHYGGTTYAVDHDEYGEVRETSQCARHVLATGRCKDYEPSDKAAPAPKSLAPTETVGNAAAMRAALESVRDWCLNRLGNASFQVTIEGLLSIVNYALAAPARNCDMTKDEAEEVFRREFGRPWNTVEDRLAAWLFAPEEGGGNAYK